MFLFKTKRIVRGICPRHNLSVAIVVPFIESQIPALKENLQTWAQGSFFPCSGLFRQHFEQAEGPLQSPNAHTGPLFQHKMRLFFYFNNNFSKRIEQEILSAWKVKGSLPRLFLLYLKLVIRTHFTGNREQ